MFGSVVSSIGSRQGRRCLLVARSLGRLENHDHLEIALAQAERRETDTMK